VRWVSSARLGTRTKESNKYASHILNESIRRTEREAHSCVIWCDPKGIFPLGATPAEDGQSACLLSLSIHVGTRKVVTYA